MNPEKDIHGVLNAITGAAIAVATAIYFEQLPTPLLVVLFVASNILVLREIWMMGGRKIWAIKSK